MSGKCEICGEYYIWSSHKCEPMWYCVHAEDYGYGDYCPSTDTIVSDGYGIYAKDAKEAAIKFAERYQARGNWYPSEMKVVVLDAAEEKALLYVVDQEAVPSYSVSYMYEPKTLTPDKSEE